MQKGFTHLFTLILLFIVLIALLFLSLTIGKKFVNNKEDLNGDFLQQDSTQRNQGNYLNQIIDGQNAEEAPVAEASAAPNLLGTATNVSYTVSTFNLASTTVITDTAGDDDCGNSCPTKSVAQYVKDNGGRAGMNGTYFCPPDYSWCSGKVNSYDFPVWNNRKKKWMQASKLFWGGRGMMVFRSGSAQFFSCATCAGAPSDITGGIVNYPSLLSGGKIILDEGSLPDNLKVTKGTRSGIGFGGGKLFLVVARRANMKDLAGIFISLGATEALNLDGGGSVAIYDAGRYRAGPGRSLPNAVIVK